MTRFFRYVPHALVRQYELIGWWSVDDLGETHGDYCLLMQWPCSCKCVEPVNVPA